MKTLRKRDVVTISGIKYTVLRIFGEAKGGRYYLVTDGNKMYTLKAFNETALPNGDSKSKMKRELECYNTLSPLNINMPKLITCDEENQALLKEYIPGPSINMLVLEQGMKDEYFDQIGEMCKVLYDKGLNIDYFPTNFVVNDNVVFYLEYDCFDYSDARNFANWGAKYWYLAGARTDE